jgi:hydroxypyruvate reductase
VAASRCAAGFVADARADFLRTGGPTLVLLLSGGASALMTLPADGVSLGDCRAVTNTLLRAGAPIADLNAVRKHLEALKGGGLARAAAPMPVFTMILSDVIGDDLSSIGSGPTCADPTTFADALAILERYHALDAAPRATACLRGGAAGARQETVKPHDPVLRGVQHRIIANNRTALDGVVHRAQDLGYHVVQATDGVTGEAREVGRRLAKQAVDLQHALTRPFALVLGGETTVTVRGDGLGGRNQEFALAAAIEIAGKGHIVIASFSTDGIDGPTDAAGAVATSSSVSDAAARGVDAAAALARNDSYRFFQAAGGLIRTGPTGTNVNDIAIALVGVALPPLL